MSLLHTVQVPRRPVALLEPVIGPARYEQLARAASQVRPALAGRTIWNVNSAEADGGVAEMLQAPVGYVQDLDIPVGWLVITGDAGSWASARIEARAARARRSSPAGGPACHSRIVGGDGSVAGMRAAIRSAGFAFCGTLRSGNTGCPGVHGTIGTRLAQG